MGFFDEVLNKQKKKKEEEKTAASAASVSGSPGLLPFLLKAVGIAAVSYFAKQFWEENKAKQKKESSDPKTTRKETVVLEVHLKNACFATWKELFDEDGKNRAAICDESRTLCAKVSDSLAIVTLYEVDMEKFKEFTEDKDFAKMIEPYVEKHVPYVGTELVAPPEE